MKNMNDKELGLKGKIIYFIGIKGVGMTMLAQFLAAKGAKISGSDVPEVFLTDRVLKDSKIEVFCGFNPENIPSNVDIIIHSSAYNEKNNPELGYLKNNKNLFSSVKIRTYAVALGEIFNMYQGVAVCGSHGKTTTSAWLGYLLLKANLEPNVLVGSRVPQFKGSSLIGKSNLFVAEVDEYQNKLQYFSPLMVLLNNIDYDHPDFFKTEASYLKVFRDFVKRIPASGFLVVNADDAKALKISRLAKAKVITYSLDSKNTDPSKYDYLAYDIKISKLKQSFKVNNLGTFNISLLGKHNVANALGVIAVALELGVSLPEIKKHLQSFKGTERRNQLLGNYNGALYIDDYAHHPTEIKATLQAIKEAYADKKIITVFHPHTFTRTKALFNDFTKSFFASDELIILNIYASAREKQGGVSSLSLVRAIKAENRKKKNGAALKQVVKNIETIPEVVDYLKGRAKSGDLVLLMGAGDVFRVADMILKKKK